MGDMTFTITVREAIYLGAGLFLGFILGMMLPRAGPSNYEPLPPPAPVTTTVAPLDPIIVGIIGAVGVVVVVGLVLFLVQKR